MPFSKDDFLLALKEKKNDERLVHTLLRLIREGRIKSVELRQEEETRIISSKGIQTIIHKRGYQTGEGTLRELDSEVRLLIDIAIQAAKLNHRKTLKPGDITGASFSFKNR